MNRKALIVVAAAGLASMAANGQQAATPAAPVKTWTDSVTIQGDLRYRTELIKEDGKDDRQRDRIRARIGAAAKINDQVKGEIQFSTGDKDPTGANKTIGDGIQKKDMGLNLAYIDWTAAPGVDLIGGKMKNPFICVSDLIWYSLLTPEGVAAKGERTVGPMTCYANAGYMWIQERSTNPDEDTKLYAGQAAAKYQMNDKVSLTAGGGYYTYDNIEGMNVIDWQNLNATYGNSAANKITGTTTNKVYAMEYNLVEAFAKLAVSVAMPVEFYGHYVVNQGADDNDTGWLAGVGVGKLSAPGTMEAGYNYRELQKDAVIGAFADPDSWGGGTDGRGHKVYGRYQIARNVQIGASVFLNEKTISDAAKKHDYDRFQLDVVASF